MPQDDLVYIKHAIEAAQKARKFIKDRTRADLDKDEMLALSLVRLLEVIGEAANLVSSEFKKKHPSVPWKKMIGLRNRLIHGYFDINLTIVWDTVDRDLPSLLEALQLILDED